MHCLGSQSGQPHAMPITCGKQAEKWIWSLLQIFDHSLEDDGWSSLAGESTLCHSCIDRDALSLATKHIQSRKQSYQSLHHLAVCLCHLLHSLFPALLALLSPQTQRLTQPNHSNAQHDSLQAATQVKEGNEAVHSLDHSLSQQNKALKLMIESHF